MDRIRGLRAWGGHVREIVDRIPLFFLASIYLALQRARL